jgi:hypothetical protein
MIGGKNVQESTESYKRFVTSGIAKDMNIGFWEDVKGQAVLGSDDFIDWVYENYLSKQDVDISELPGIKDLKIGPNTPEEIANPTSRCSFNIFRVMSYIFEQEYESCTDGKKIRRY